MWSDYVRRMAEAYTRLWPSSVPLTVYAEDFDVDVEDVGQERLPRWFNVWKKQLANDKDAHGRDRKRMRPKSLPKGYEYRRDCVKFAHKVAAIVHAGAKQREDLLIWIDADTVTHERVDETWLRSLFGEGDHYMAWLSRRRVYPECGFLMFDCGHSAHENFMSALRNIYESRAVFDLPETHDSYVIDGLVGMFVREGLFPKPRCLSGERGRESMHPFVHSELASRLDHFKGPRKRMKRTPKNESSRTERHWR